MTSRQFALTWDYRCPFARNAHEHVLAALDAGADFDVTFVPFSLGQSHVAEGETSVWDEPEKDSGLLALQAGVAVREHYPDKFLAAHLALFAARHDKGQHLRDEAVVREALESVGVDADDILARIATGEVLKVVQAEHEAAVRDHAVWGVPTFIAGDESVFVRVMDRPAGDGAKATAAVDRIYDLLVGFPELNEFKHTTLKR